MSSPIPLHDAYPAHPAHQMNPPNSRYAHGIRPRSGLRLVPVPPLGETAHDDDIPDPSTGFVRALAVQGYEAIAGTRTIAQLGPLISVGLARQLAVLRAVRNDRRLVYRDERHRAPRAGGVRISRPGPAVAEASAVLFVGSRAHAVALRLEWAHRHWRATELTVL